LISMAVLVAASTVEPALVPASSHASFLRAGKASEPVEIRVDRSHDSRRFARRRVSFSQQETFCVCDVSYHRPDEPDGGWTRDAPELPDAETLPAAPSTLYLGNMEVRPVAGPQINAIDDITFPLWARFPVGVPKSPTWNAAALSWAAEYYPTQSALLASGRSSKEYIALTLEHSMWFHRPIDVSQWMQIDYGPVSLADLRLHTHGAIYDERGTLAATMVQAGIMLPDSRFNAS
jgi:acyl-CoA thioesterase-2